MVLNKIVRQSCLILVAMLGFTSSASAKELRIATLAPPGSTWMKELDRGAVEIAKVTDGRVTLKYYPGGVMGDERQAIQKMKIKQLDGTGVTSVGLAMVDQSIRVLELPMLFKSKAEMEYVVKRMWPYFQRKFSKQGYELTGRGEVGWIHFFSKKPIKSVADLKAAKLWMWQDDKLVAAMYKKLGINGVPLAVPDVKSALNSGKVNAVYGSPLTTVALQWNTKIKYVTSMRPVYAVSATILRKDSLNGISSADQQAIKQVMRKVRRRLIRNVRRDNKVALKQMKRKGVTMVETPKSVQDTYASEAQEVWQEQVGKLYSKGELTLVLKFRDQYRAKDK